MNEEVENQEEGQKEPEVSSVEEPKQDPSEDLRKQLSDSELRHRQEMSELQQQYQQQLYSLASSRDSQQVPTAPEITEDDIARIISGEEEDPKKIAQYINQETDKRTQQLQKQLEQVSSQSQAQIRTIAFQQAKMNTERMPHFTRFEKEIKATVNQMGGNLSSEAIEGAYDYVVGQNFQVLLNEEREKFLRNSQGGMDQLPPGQKNSRGGGTSGEDRYKAEEVLTPGSLRALESKHTTPDLFAKRMKFDSFADMAKSSESLRAQEEEQNKIWLTAEQHEWTNYLKNKKAGAA